MLTDDPQVLLPLTPTIFQILLTLAGGERHGYGIMQDILVNTDGKLKIGPGMLYGSLKRMLTLGLIEASDERPDPTLDDQRRIYYRLTPFGRLVAEAEAERLSKIVQLAQDRHLVRRREAEGGATG